MFDTAKHGSNTIGDNDRNDGTHDAVKGNKGKIWLIQKGVMDKSDELEYEPDPRDCYIPKVLSSKILIVLFLFDK